MAGRTDGLALAMIGAGALFAYAGIKGKSVPAALSALITGKSPATAGTANPITGSSGSGGTAPGSPVGSTSEIAAAAMKYDGTHNYDFGAPPPPGKVDCSSWATDVVGHDCGLPVPGGTWAEVTKNGTVHGPDTISYLGWSGAETVGHHSSVAQPGDLAVWQTHMGIVIGPNQMISAQDPALGTGKSVIDGAIPGELLFIRRIIIGNPHG
jgi:cell wall-associated NlpC family hydrolase